MDLHLAGTSVDHLEDAVAATDSSLPHPQCRSLTDMTLTTVTAWSVKPIMLEWVDQWEETGWTDPHQAIVSHLPTEWVTGSQTPETDCPRPDPSWKTEIPAVLTPTSETGIPLAPDLPLSTMNASWAWELAAVALTQLVLPAPPLAGVAASMAWAMVVGTTTPGQAWTAPAWEEQPEVGPLQGETTSDRAELGLAGARGDTAVNRGAWEVGSR